MRITVVSKYLAVALIGTLPGLALADPIADFYKGKQLEVVIRSNPGGNYDQYSRLLFNHMTKHIPGNPTVVYRHMTGGSGIQAVNYMEGPAPQDGTVLSLINNGLVIDQALGQAKGMKADMGKLNWIGNMTASNDVIVAWHTSPVKSVEEARKTEMTVGAASAASGGAKFTAAANALGGTRFKLALGYPGNADLNLAMERGETMGRAGGLWSTVKATNPDWIKEKKIIPLVQIGMTKEPDLPNVPLLIELSQDPTNRAALEFITKGQAIGRPLAVASGVPKDRVEALRKAFEATMKDPGFIAEAEKTRAEIEPRPGEVVAGLVADVLAAPEDIRAKARKAMGD